MVEDWQVPSVLPNEHPLRDERVELVPSLDGSDQVVISCSTILILRFIRLSSQPLGCAM